MRGTIVCPSVEGATNWMSPAYNPDTGLYYVQALERCSVFQKSSRGFEPGESFYGGSTRTCPGRDRRQGPARASRSAPAASPGNCRRSGRATPGRGVLSTASGLVFTGEDDGTFSALDARDGRAALAVRGQCGVARIADDLPGTRPPARGDCRRRSRSTRSRWRRLERSRCKCRATPNAGTFEGEAPNARRPVVEGLRPKLKPSSARSLSFRRRGCRRRAFRLTRADRAIRGGRCTVPRMRRAVLFAALGLLVSPVVAQGPPEYDFLIKGGRVIDPRNSLDAVRDVAIKDGTIAAVAHRHRRHAGDEGRRRARAGRHARSHRHPRARVPRREVARLRRWRLERLPGWLHAAQLRDHGERRRHVRLAQFPRLQAPRHRRVEDPRHRVPQHRRQRHGLRADRAERRRHGRRSDGQDGVAAQGRRRRHQERALQRHGLEALRAGGDCRAAGRHPGDDRFRRQREGRPDAHGPVHEVPAPGRHLHAHVRRRAWRVRRSDQRGRAPR